MEVVYYPRHHPTHRQVRSDIALPHATDRLLGFGKDLQLGHLNWPSGVRNPGPVPIRYQDGFSDLFEVYTIFTKYIQYSSKEVVKKR